MDTGETRGTLSQEPLYAFLLQNPMNKPTAQELWEKICESLDWEYSPDGGWEKIEDQYTRELIQQYAQTYHEERTQGTIIDIDGQRYTAVLTPYNPQHND